jgi:hypothetical protein
VLTDPHRDERVAVARLSPRALLTAQSLDTSRAPDERSGRRNRRLSGLVAAVGLVLLVLGFARPSAQAGAFFGAGAALLVGALLWLAGWLRARDRRLLAGRGAWAVARLGFRSTAFRPARSVLSAALIASAAFIIVSVDAFRREGSDLSADPKSGTGGYVLFAESELPLPNPNGRQAARRSSSRLRLAEVRTAFGSVPGGCSCLNSIGRPT